MVLMIEVRNDVGAFEIHQIEKRVFSECSLNGIARNV